MAGSFPLLLLAVLVPAAVATVAVGLQPAAPCEPALTAWEISRVCSAGRPTARCCGRVMAVVELGGGVPCLCRVAALPELAMAGLDVKRLFTSCGGARLTAACEGPAPSVAVVKAMPLPRRKLVAAPVRSNATCPSATEMATSVAIDCGQGISDPVPCCAALKQAISMSKVVDCICTLERAAPIQEVRLEARDLIKNYASCMSMRPGDVHFPRDGCASVPPNTMGSPPPAASPAVGTLSPPAAASPAVGTLSAHPSKERDTTPAPSNDHAILVAILVLLVIFGFVACTGGAVYLIFKVKARGGWMLLGRARANEQQQPNIIIANDAAQPEASASTSASASDALSTVVNNVMRHTAELQKHLRRSGRLAGMEPTHSGLQ